MERVDRRKIGGKKVGRPISDYTVSVIFDERKSGEVGIDDQV